MEQRLFTFETLFLWGKDRGSAEGPKTEALGLPFALQFVPLRSLASVLVICEPLLTSSLFCLAFEFFSLWLRDLHKNSIEPLFLLRGLALWGAAFALLWSGREALKQYASHLWRVRVEGSIRRRVLHALHQIGIPTLEGEHPGVWIPRLRKDLVQLESFLVESLPQHVRASVFFLVIFLYGISFFGKEAFVLFPLAGLVMGVGHFYYRRVGRIHKDLRGIQNAQISLLLESLEGTRTLRVQGAEPFIHRRFDEIQDKLIHRSLAAARENASLTLLQEFILRAAAVVLALLGVSILISHASDVAVVSISILFAVFVTHSREGFLSLGKILTDWRQFNFDSRRIFDLLQASTKEARFGSRPGLDTMGVAALVLKSAVVESLEGDLGPWNLKLSRGELWAISGPSSSGKTALLEVVAGLRPLKGGRAEILKVSGALQWASQGESTQIPQGLSAFVEQHPYLFEGTVRENLTLGNQHRLSDTLLWSMIEGLGLTPTINKLGGLSGLVRSRGEGLSHGERYRMALGRAILLRRPFLLVDEPFGKLDEPTLEKVREALLKEKKSGVGVLIATRFSDPQLILDGRIEVSNLSLTAASPIENSVLA